MAKVPAYFAVYIKGKKGPCDITLEKESIYPMTVTWDLVNKKPIEADHSIQRQGKKFTFSIKVPPRKKLNKEDVMFLEDYAYLRVDS